MVPQGYRQVPLPVELITQFAHRPRVRDETERVSSGNPHELGGVQGELSLMEHVGVIRGDEVPGETWSAAKTSRQIRSSARPSSLAAAASSLLTS